VICNAERHSGILFHEQNRDLLFFVDPLDYVEYLPPA
jgi:hypothetical protein